MSLKRFLSLSVFILFFAVLAANPQKVLAQAKVTIDASSSPETKKAVKDAEEAKEKAEEDKEDAEREAKKAKEDIAADSESDDSQPKTAQGEEEPDTEIPSPKGSDSKDSETPDKDKKASPRTIPDQPQNKLDEEEGPEYSVFDRSYYLVKFLRNSGTGSNLFTMRLSSPGLVSGCARLTEPEVKIIRNGNRAKLEVTDSEVELKNDVPRYGSHDCQTETNSSYFDVELNRDELIDNNVTSISVKSKLHGQYSSDKIEVTKEKIVMDTTYPWGAERITYWFYPSNTVILMAPAAKQDEDVKDLIANFAQTKGLIPLENTLNGYELPHSAKNFAYYTDPSGRITRGLNKDEKKVIGSITTYRPILSATGETSQAQNLDIIARLPGASD